MTEDKTPSELNATPSLQENLFVRLRSKVTLPIALIILILLAAVIVAVGFGAYWNDNNRKYDIARGNKESKNQALSVEDGTTDRTSPADTAAVNQKIDFLDKEVKALSAMGNFDPADVSNENLQLVTPDQPSL